MTCDGASPFVDEGCVHADRIFVIVVAIVGARVPAAFIHDIRRVLHPGVERIVEYDAVDRHADRPHRQRVVGVVGIGDLRVGIEHRLEWQAVGFVELLDVI